MEKLAGKVGNGQLKSFALKWITNKDCIAQGALLCDRLDGRGVWESGYMCMYGRVPLLSAWNCYSLVNTTLLISYVLSRVWLFATPWTVPCQAPLSMEFSRQEYWSGLPFPTLEDLHNPGIKPTSPVSPTSLCITGRFFTQWTIGEAPNQLHFNMK